MAETGEKIVVEGDILDRISNLPIKVLSRVLDFLPFTDLARTSVLSRNWRYVWAYHPNIKIDYHYLDSNKRENMSSIVNKIFLQHIGSLLKFSLVVPPTHAFGYSFIHHWLLYLSRNGIKELTLNCTICMKFFPLPSLVFSALELVVLNLTNVVFNTPHEHAYFHKLTILNFSNISFQTGELKSAIITPQLTHLTFKQCSGIYYFKICAPKLKTLTIEDCGDVNFNGFEMPEITILVLTICDSKRMSLTELFEKCRLISCFYVDARVFEYLVADMTHLERLPLMAGYLKHLVIRYIDEVDLHHISCMLYLLKSSTTLSRLEILMVATNPDGWNVTYKTNRVLKYLDATHNMKWTANSLEVVIIDGSCGSEIQMCLIKLLLSRAPKLRTMFVKPISNENMSIKLSERLMGFPRASTEAEIIFESNVRVAKIPEVYSLC